MATIVFGDFEWDAEKAASNLAKHGVTFEEATTVFLDPDFLLTADAHSPERFLALGFSSSARLLLVVHVERSERVRIISARATTRNEADGYARRKDPT